MGIAMDGKERWLATAGEDREIKVWDLANGKLLWTLKGHYLPAIQLAMSLDGRYLASHVFGEGQGALLWDLKTGAQLGKYGPRKDSYGFHPTKPWIRTGAEFWDIQTHQKVGDVTDKFSSSNIQISRDGQFLATEGEAGINIFDAVTFDKLRSLPVRNRNSRTLMFAFSDSGKSLWSFLNELDEGYEGQGQVWDTGTWNARSWSIQEQKTQLPRDTEGEFPWPWGASGLMNPTPNGKTIITFGGYQDEGC